MCAKIIIIQNQIRSRPRIARITVSLMFAVTLMGDNNAAACMLSDIRWKTYPEGWQKWRR
jgi:hypothetical protein